MKRINRQAWIKGVVRGGVLAGIVGLCAVLGRREEKVECSNRCGKCPEFKEGKCGLGLK